MVGGEGGLGERVGGLEKVDIGYWQLLSIRRTLVGLVQDQEVKRQDGEVGVDFVGVFDLLVVKLSVSVAGEHVIGKHTGELLVVVELRGG